jgi:hypothetical protein
LKTPERNTNIPAIFYCKKDFQEKLKDENNNIEPIWKQRILLENTPRGNILMFYDPFRFGFSYYADTATIPYSLLNSVAMKYVRIYQCGDFFMDDETEFISPLIAIYKENETVSDKKEEKENTKDSELHNLIADGPFIKRKKAVIEEKPIEKIAPSPKVDFYRNKFIYLGKIHNYSFLKKEPIISTINKGSHKFKEVFSYTEYKKNYKKWLF